MLMSKYHASLAIMFSVKHVLSMYSIENKKRSPLPLPSIACLLSHFFYIISWTIFN